MGHLLTIEQATKMLTLEKFALVHESRQRSGPTLSQHLNPLEIQLQMNNIIGWKMQLKVNTSKSHIAGIQMLSLGSVHFPQHVVVFSGAAELFSRISSLTEVINRSPRLTLVILTDGRFSASAVAAGRWSASTNNSFTGVTACRGRIWRSCIRAGKRKPKFSKILKKSQCATQK